MEGYITISIMFCIFLLITILSTKVLAANEVEITKVEITTPTGIYKEGNKITARLTFSKPDAMKDTVALNGDIYVWICEIDDTTGVAKILVNAKKIEREPQLPLGSRVNAYFFDNTTSFYCWETYQQQEKL